MLMVKGLAGVPLHVCAVIILPSLGRGSVGHGQSQILKQMEEVGALFWSYRLARVIQNQQKWLVPGQSQKTWAKPCSAVSWIWVVDTPLPPPLFLS